MFQSVLSNAVRNYGRDDDYSSSSPPTKYPSISLSNISAALTNSPVVDTLRRGSAQIVDFFQSRTGFDMSGQTPQNGETGAFGYVFRNSDLSQASPQAPQAAQPSEPLLNLQENGFLASFFQSQQNQSHSQSPTMNYSGLNHIDQTQNMEANYNWLMNEPPPTIHDISTASIPSTAHNQQNHHNISPSMVMNGLQMSINDDILGAAALLTQPLHSRPHATLHSMHDPTNMSPTFHMQRSQTQPILSPHVFTTAMLQESLPATMEPVHTDDALAGINSSTTINSMHANQQATLMSALIPRLDTSPTTLSAVPMVSAPQTAPAAGSTDQIPNPRLYHFGSDSHFDGSGFRPSSKFEAHEYRAELISSELRRLKPINRTPEISRETSPASHARQLKIEAGGTDINPTHLLHKRKRSNDSETSLLDDDDEATTTKTGRKRGRRSSAPSSSKSKRENLSDKQKRANHIASEQKRRAQIKSGFDELNRIVPELREGGLSKSGVLMEACNFLELLKNMNDKLCQRLGLPPPF